MFTMERVTETMLGGTWGNGDTSLKELEVTGGTLSPSFDRGDHQLCPDPGRRRCVGHTYSGKQKFPGQDIYQ